MLKAESVRRTRHRLRRKVFIVTAQFLRQFVRQLLRYKQGVCRDGTFLGRALAGEFRFAWRRHQDFCAMTRIARMGLVCERIEVRS